MAEEETVEELQAKITLYQGQLQQLEAALTLDPKNAEVLLMFEQLAQVVELSKTMLELKKAQEVTNNTSKEVENSTNGTESNNNNNQVKVGTKLKAKWSGDGLIYPGVVTAIKTKEDGEVIYNVSFTGYNTAEDVKFEDLVLPKPKDPADKKRKVQLDNSGNVIVPKHLVISPNDTEETRTIKRKKVHALKTTGRFQKIDEEHSQRQSDWKSFLTTKANVKKTGYFTGRQKESIFKTPENPDSKVGVTGSGKGMTQSVAYEPLAKKALPGKPDEI